MPERLDPAGWATISHDVIDSTNAEAMRHAATGERGPLWITAAHQSRGRGRSGRSWTSAGDSLAATLLFSPACNIRELPGLSLVAGVAAHGAIVRALPERVGSAIRLKWPNDVLIGGVKVCGILIESTVIGAKAVAGIGIGINVGAPALLGGRATTSLAEHGGTIGTAGMSTLLAAELALALGRWNDGRGFAQIRDDWLCRAGPIGEALTVNDGNGPVSGRYVGLDTEGALLLDVGEGDVRRFVFADVMLGGTPATS